MTQSAARLRAHARLLGERLDSRGLARADAVSGDPVPMAFDGPGHAFLFRWGVVVTIGVDADREQALLAGLASRVLHKLGTRVDETAMLAGGAEQDGVDADGTIRLVDLSAPRLSIVAEALAKSAALAHQEATLATTLDSIEPLIAKLRDRGRMPTSSRLLLRTIGMALSARSRTATRVQAEDKPDILWDHPELERLYARLADEFELSERGAALDRKLALLGDATTTLMSLVEAQRSLALEIAIVVLIAIEVVPLVWRWIVP
jgi:uncharacterized Rmd1/YagE family protein